MEAQNTKSEATIGYFSELILFDIRLSYNVGTMKRGGVAI